MRTSDHLVGRERELEQLGGVMAAAETGEGRLLLLAGEAGVGKTSLAAAALTAGRLEALRGAED